MLPDTLLTCHAYAQFISLYRQLLTEIVMYELRDSQDAGFIMDPVISTFPKILSIHDVMDVLKVSTSLTYVCYSFRLVLPLSSCLNECILTFS